MPPVTKKTIAKPSVKSADQPVKTGKKQYCEEDIRNKAFEIYVREGYPQGRESDHWEQAKKELGIK